jgi:probable phosphoglycerate mutase
MGSGRDTVWYASLMTIFFLIRHGANDTIGHGISGRGPGVTLNAEGRAQAKALAERLAAAELAMVYCSPMERTRETAEAVASRTGVPLRVMDELTEVDFGEWTGRAFSELEQDPRWLGFNRLRSMTRIPGGELMLETQARMVAALERLRTVHPDERIGVVSHGDPIRSALVHYAGIPIDLMQRIHIDLASVSVVVVDGHGVAIRFINHTGECR